MNFMDTFFSSRTGMTTSHNYLRNIKQWRINKQKVLVYRLNSFRFCLHMEFRSRVSRILISLHFRFELRWRKTDWKTVTFVVQIEFVAVVHDSFHPRWSTNSPFIRTWRTEEKLPLLENCFFSSLEFLIKFFLFSFTRSADSTQLNSTQLSTWSFLLFRCASHKLF